MAIEAIIRLKQPAVITLDRIGKAQVGPLIEYKNHKIPVEAYVQPVTLKGKIKRGKAGYAPLNTNQVRQVVSQVGIEEVIRHGIKGS